MWEIGSFLSKNMVFLLFFFFVDFFGYFKFFEKRLFLPERAENLDANYFFVSLQQHARWKFSDCVSGNFDKNFFGEFFCGKDMFLKNHLLVRFYIQTFLCLIQLGPTFSLLQSTLCMCFLRKKTTHDFSIKKSFHFRKFQTFCS